MDSILSNAISSIQLGVEDYENPDPRRSLSALRNMSAGILLLFKEKLRRLSPANSGEVLLKQRISPKYDPQGVEFVGNGPKTVDFPQIQERLTSLQVNVDWRRVAKIIRLRNEIEHYRTDAPSERLREMVADSFVIISQFLETHLNHSPIELLGAKTWNVLLSTNELYAQQEQLCAEVMARVTWDSPTLERVKDYFRCTHCESSLLRPMDETLHPPVELTFHCARCGKTSEFDDVIEEACDEALAGDNYISIKDGGDAVNEQCDACDRHAFIFDEQRCIACWEKHTQATCGRCGDAIPPHSYGGICDRCDYHDSLESH